MWVHWACCDSIISTPALLPNLLPFTQILLNFVTRGHRGLLHIPPVFTRVRLLCQEQLLSKQEGFSFTLIFLSSSMMLKLKTYRYVYRSIIIRLKEIIYFLLAHFHLQVKQWYWFAHGSAEGAGVRVHFYFQDFKWHMLYFTAQRESSQITDNLYVFFMNHNSIIFNWLKMS